MRDILERNLRLFADPRRFTMVVGGYCALHYVWRVSSSSALGRDDVEQALFAQHWALTYDPAQPPLYTWLLRALIETTGLDGVAAHALLKAVLVFLALGGLAAASEQLLRRAPARDTTLPRLAAASPMLTVVLGWDMLQLYTHTVLLFAMMPAVLWALTRLDPALRDGPVGGTDYVLLGVLLGLGLLTKYSFPLFAVALGTAAFRDGALRRALFTWRGAIVLVFAAGIAAPHYIAVIAAPSAFQAAASEAVGLDPALSRIGTLTAAFESLGSALVAFVALPVILGILCLRPWRGPWRRSNPCHRDGAALLERMALVTGLVWILGVLCFGTGRVQPHHLVVPLVLLPSWYFLAGPIPDRTALRLFAGAISAATLIAAVALPVKFATEVTVYDCRRCYLHRPYREIAEAMRATGFSGGTVIADDRLLAGGLVPFLPDSLVLAADYPWFLPNQPTSRACLVIWQIHDTADPTPPGRLVAFMETRLGGSLPETATPILTAFPLATQTRRQFTVGALALPACARATRSP